MSVLCGLNKSVIAVAKKHYDAVLTDIVLPYREVHRYVRPVICVVGVLANIAIILVLLRPVMRRSPINILLIVIAVFDMTLMATYFVFGAIEMCNPVFFSYAWIVYTQFYAIFSVFAHSASLWLTVVMAGMRYLILRQARSSRGGPSVDSTRGAVIGVIIAMIISLIGSVPNFLRYNIIDHGARPVPSLCTAETSTYRRHFVNESSTVNAFSLGRPEWWNCGWERFNFWTSGMLLKIMPCVLLTIFMALLVRLLVEARQRRNRLRRTIHTDTNRRSRRSSAERTTTMLILIVLVFLVTELPQGMLVVATGIQPTVLFIMSHFGDVLDLLSLINSSFNFVLYCTMSAQFRLQFILTFGACCKRCFAMPRDTVTTFITSRAAPNDMKSECARLTTELNGNGPLSASVVLSASVDESPNGGDQRLAATAV
uniref:G-protein coupled receptors family 1 profile domain-containing protein n=1 Tax=Plectus sambesii TaxID=2011161 RepID=A0A914WCR0_9BILA